MTVQTFPQTYLSRSEGRFRVIHKALPIAPDRASREEALADASIYGLTVGPQIWDGDAGAFVHDTAGPPRGWGLVPADGTRYHWSARAIYPVDLLWDRMAVEGEASPEERKALGAWLDDKALPYLRAWFARGEDVPYQSEDREITVSGDGFTLRASPRASYGYLYLSAAPDPSATGKTPKAPRARAANVKRSKRPTRSAARRPAW